MPKPFKADAAGARAESRATESRARAPRFAELDAAILNQEIRELRDPRSRTGRAWRPEERAERLHGLVCERMRRVSREFRAKRKRDSRQAGWRTRRAAYLARGGRWDDLRKEGFR